MIDYRFWPSHGCSPTDGHRYLRYIDINADGTMGITYDNSTVDTLTTDDIIYLYNNAIDSLVYYKDKCVDLYTISNTPFESLYDFNIFLYG